MSLLRSKTAATVHAELEMARTANPMKKFVVVEGVDDYRFWSSQLRKSTFEIVDAEGVCNLREAMKELPATLQKKTCAVADQDFRDYCAIDPFGSCQATYFYDEGFLESFILNSGVFWKLLNVYASPKKVSRLTTRIKPRSIFSHFRDICEPFGRLRVLNMTHGWSLDFHGRFRPFRYVDPAAWITDINSLTADAATAIGTDQGALQNAILGLRRHRVFSFVHGHDALEALTIGLNGLLGAKGIGPEKLFRDCLLCFEKSHLRHKALTRQLADFAYPHSVQ